MKRILGAASVVANLLLTPPVQAAVREPPSYTSIEATRVADDAGRVLV